ncbi:transporter substrate-binding domain-containing protein [Haematobacter genomosp. 1]|uniref:Amino acid ABC transporter n=1 Tax=Haematobacter genomosp. 1 TaxID=366618 RepID=A0A212AED9_9RHOB|nr:transporter substrate-binding domain-containing protein [Haematobacter genomosp. 1]OWJ79684.1 amino acid ABC transporter [Haematobacter genomosp. 1]
MKSRLSFVFTLAGLLAATQPVGADVLADVKKAGELRIGTETEFAPFDYVDAGDHVGFNVDLFNEVGKELGVKIGWIALPWAGVLPGLETKKFDMVAGPAVITKARMERYAYSAPIADGTVTLVKRANDDSIQKPEDIAGKAIGGARSSSQLAQMKAFAETLNPQPTVREYVGVNEASSDLAAGRIAAIAQSLPSGTFAAKRRPDTFAVVMPPFGEKAYFGYMFRKDADSASLLDAVNEVIDRMKADGRLAAMQTKWFGVVFETPDRVTDPAL